MTTGTHRSTSHGPLPPVFRMTCCPKFGTSHCVVSVVISVTISTPTFPTTTTYPLVRHFLATPQRSTEWYPVRISELWFATRPHVFLFFALTTPRLRGIHGMLDAKSNGTLACDHTLPEFGALHFFG